MVHKVLTQQDTNFNVTIVFHIT